MKIKEPTRSQRLAVIRLMRRARDILAEKGWCRKVSARNRHGEWVEIDDAT